MTKRRGNSEGTVYHDEKGDRWIGQLTVGYDPVTRKQKRRSFYGATRMEVQKKMLEARGQPLDPESDQPLSVAIDFWLCAHKCRVDPVTALRYEQELAPVKEFLGKCLLPRLTALNVEALYGWMADQGHTLDAQKRAGARLRMCLKRCVELGLVRQNMALRVPLPRPVRPEAESLSQEALARLLEAAKGHRYEALIVLALDSGARLGELVALTWEDVDLAAGEVRLNKSVQRHKGVLRVKTTKTPKGRRRVPITPLSCDLLKARRPSEAPETALVFPRHRTGTLMHAGHVYKGCWFPLREKAGLGVPGFHVLRHTCATLLLLANVHPKVVSERLGHARIEITLNTYSHLLPSMQGSAVTALQAALTPPLSRSISTSTRADSIPRAFNQASGNRGPSPQVHWEAGLVVAGVPREGGNQAGLQIHDRGFDPHRGLYS